MPLVGRFAPSPCTKPGLLQWLLLASIASALPASRATATEKPTPAPASIHAAKRFAALVTEAPDLAYDELLAQLDIKPAAAAKLSFTPRKARYYAEVERALGLADREKQTLDTFGFAMVDHGNKLSMGQAYLEIYRADLPVFVTADSILHALHRSYDEILRQIEEDSLFSNLDMALAKIQTALCELPKTSSSRANLSDLNVAVAVARKLLEPGRKEGEETVAAAACGDEQTIAALLKKVAGLVPDSPDGPGTSLSGRKRPVDWSQFKPRGHYTETPRLQAYFRAMMWLGRADIAWRIDKDRELRDAALLMLLATKAEQKARLSEMSRLIDFFVGRADSLGPEGMDAALAAAGVESREQLFQATALARLRAEVAKRPEAMQQIRSEVVNVNPGSSKETPLAMAFQLFGQRFVIDSFVLSKKDGKSQNWGSAVAVEAFFGRFAKTMDRLAAIASKELSAAPLDADEKQFLKHVIEQKTSVGCVVTTYLTGWYTQLVYLGDPVKREPTIADVHTDPNSGTVLEAGVGDVRYMVIAVDNDKDRALYVGPTYSYYEFASATRLTDKDWEPKIQTTPMPGFIRDFTSGPVPRKMTAPTKKAEPSRRSDDE